LSAAPPANLPSRVTAPINLAARLSALGVKGSRWAVALSGGPDSTALLSLLLEINPQTEALIVDHGLRPESMAEAQRTTAQARALGAQTRILQWEGEKPTTHIQVSARQARYRLLGEYCEANRISHLFLAHHANDQLETVALRAERSSGWRGLAGMPWVSERGDITLVRPLLDVMKGELVSHCDRQGLSYVLDPSNSNPRFARAQLRHVGGDLARYVSIQHENARRRQQEIAVLSALDGQTYRVCVSGGYATVLREALTQPGLLRVMLGLIGQADYPPNEAQEMAAIGRLQKGQGLTLAGSRLLCRSEDILIVREPAAIVPVEVAVGTTQLRWDRRWLVRGKVGERVEPLAGHPWRSLAQAKELDVLPGAARAALPFGVGQGVLERRWSPLARPLRQIFEINEGNAPLSAKS